MRPRWVSPYDDKLGFYKVAKNYHLSGCGRRPGIDLRQHQPWEALPKDYQAIFELRHEASASTWPLSTMRSILRLTATDRQRVKLLPFSNDIMAACHQRDGGRTTESPPEREIQEDPRAVKKIPEDQVQWFAVAENRFDNFMIAAERLSRKK
jgi:TRAP-type mannitol/chloroaromatic compound transport system substrate-binding protein